MGDIGRFLVSAFRLPPSPQRFQGLRARRSPLVNVPCNLRAPKYDERRPCRSPHRICLISRVSCLDPTPLHPSSAAKATIPIYNQRRRPREDGQMRIHLSIHRSMAVSVHDSLPIRPCLGGCMGIKSSDVRDEAGYLFHGRIAAV